MSEEVKKISITDIAEFDSVDVIEVLVKVGDEVAIDQPLVTIESEKAMLDYPSPLAGVVEEVIVQDGGKIKEGDALVTLKVALHAVEPQAENLSNSSQASSRHAEPSVANSLKKIIPKEKLTVSSKKGHYVLEGIEVTAIKGKHIGPIYLYHIKIGDIRIFHGGDSSYVSLKKFPSDVAFVPTGQPSPTCSPKKAFKMARDMKPQVAVAIHGSPSQNEKFKKKMESDLAATSVVIPNYFEPVTITLKK